MQNIDRNVFMLNPFYVFFGNVVGRTRDEYSSTATSRQVLHHSIHLHAGTGGGLHSQVKTTFILPLFDNSMITVFTIFTIFKKMKLR
jgi:hypothetical protein